MDDLISREKAVAELYKLFDNMIKAGRHQMALGVNDSIVLVGELMPSAQSERKKGEWIKATGMMPPEFHGRHCCSECGNFANMEPPFGNREDLSKFCPNCGADMRGEQNDND